MFKRIIVPLDGSTRAERALPVAARIAHASGGTIILLWVVTTPLKIGPQVVPLSGHTATTLKADVDAATKYLAAVASRDDLDGVGIKMEVIAGIPAQAILDVVIDEQADLVVMCSHGDTGLKRWLHGSVAQKVARQCTAPVLVLRQGGSAPTSSFPDPLRPLRAVMAVVALDGSDLAEAAIMPAVSLITALAAPARGALQLTRVVKLPVTASERGEHDHYGYPEALDPHLIEQAVREAKTYLGSLVDRLRQGPLAEVDLTLTWSVLTGKDVADTLIRVAETGEEAEGTRVFGG